MQLGKINALLTYFKIGLREQNASFFAIYRLLLLLQMKQMSSYTFPRELIFISD